MKKKITVSLILLFVIALMSGCCLVHDWESATCTTAQTCSKCGETEGEALGHVWLEATCESAKVCSTCGEAEGEALGHALTEANYQQAAKCSICGESVGETLEADFEKYGLSCDMEVGVTYPYVNRVGDNYEYVTTGRVTVSEYNTFATDETHEAVEGYEWKTITITYEFDDEVAWNYGASAWNTQTDYYNISQMKKDLTGNNNFSVNYNGVNYSECTYEFQELKCGWYGEVCIIQHRVYVRVPINYDGIVYAIHDIIVAEGLEVDGIYINDAQNENTMYFRLDENNLINDSEQILEEIESTNNTEPVFIEEGVYYIEGLGYVDEEGYVIYYEDPNQYIQIEEGIGNDREYVPNIAEADNEFYKEVIITELQKYYNHIASHCGWPESEYDPGAYIGTQIFIDDIFTYASEGYFYNNNYTGVAEDVLVSEVRYSVFNKTQYNPFANPRQSSYEKILANWINQGCFLIEDINEIYVEILSEDEYVKFDEGRSANLKITVISSDKITYTILMASTLNLETNSEEYVLLDAMIAE